LNKILTHEIVHRRRIMKKILTRWNLLEELMMSKESRDAIGKAWPLFLFLIFNVDKSNKFITNYAELKEKLHESPNTIKTWREHLVENKVVQVFKGSTSMSFVFLPPYASLVTCEQDDVAQVKIVGDPSTKRLLEKFSSYNNMSLLPIIAELSEKITNIEKRVG
jgi:hypothetical protein